MKNTTTVMNQFSFTTKIVNPADLKVHEILADMGYDYKPDEVFVDTAKHFGFYGKPVVDGNNNVIANAAEVFAAVQNGITELEISECAMNDCELRRFIAYIHCYHRKNLVASYKTIVFYESYFETEEGIQLAAAIERKTKRDKIAYMMNTSDSTIKRLKDVGKNMPEKLGLIEQGEMSFKEVQDQIKRERMEANMRKKENPLLGDAETQSTPVTASDESDMRTGKMVDPPANDKAVSQQTKGTDEDMDGSIDNEAEDAPVTSNVIAFQVNVPVAQSALDFVQGRIEIKGIGDIAIRTESKQALLEINGEKMSATAYDKIENTGLSSGLSTTSFVFTCKNGLALSISIERPAALLKLAA